jgi:hypothetical protein
MKGDIAVAGFRMTAEEWQSLDPASRAELVAVITRRDEAVQLAAGSGPIPLELEPDPESGAIVSRHVAADVDSGAFVSRLARGTDPGGIVGGGLSAADLDVLALMSQTELPTELSGPLVTVIRDEPSAAIVADVDPAAELDFGAL